MGGAVWSRGPIVLALAALVGLCVGYAVPGAGSLRPFALPCAFLQTLIAVGVLAGVSPGAPDHWYLRAARRHVLLSSAPLMMLGMLIGFDHWLGVGVFLLGAVPPANAIPSYIAVCGGDVRSAVRFTLTSYGAGVVVTPVLILIALGTRHSIGSMVVVMLVGLVAPALLGGLLRPWMRRISQPAAIATLSASTLVVMLGMGSELSAAVSAASVDGLLLGCAALAAFGRCAWGGILGWWIERDPARRLDSAIIVACKNCVLAALIAETAAGPPAALPALLGLFAEAAVLLSAARVAHGRR